MAICESSLTPRQLCEAHSGKRVDRLSVVADGRIVLWSPRGDILRLETWDTLSHTRDVAWMCEGAGRRGPIWVEIRHLGYAHGQGAPGSLVFPG